MSFIRERERSPRGSSRRWASGELLVEVPLPMVEVWEELQTEVEELTGHAGLRIIGAILETEVTRGVGPPHHPDSASNAMPQGRQPGYVIFQRTESFRGAAPAGAHAGGRRRSGVEQLRADAARWAAAARNPRRHRGGTEFAELSPRRSKRGGGIRN